MGPDKNGKKDVLPIGIWDRFSMEILERRHLGGSGAKALVRCVLCQSVRCTAMCRLTSAGAGFSGFLLETGVKGNAFFYLYFSTFRLISGSTRNHILLNRRDRLFWGQVRCLRCYKLVSLRSLDYR
jgi:hypothetical protein